MIACRKKTEMEDLLENAQPSRSAQPLLSKELVLLGSESKDKEEAMQEIVDAFYIAGRTEDRQRLEEALVVPRSRLLHRTGLRLCRSPLQNGSRSRPTRSEYSNLIRPIDWGSVDSEPGEHDYPDRNARTATSRTGTCKFFQDLRAS